MPGGDPRQPRAPIPPQAQAPRGGAATPGGAPIRRIRPSPTGSSSNSTNPPPGVREEAARKDLQLPRAAGHRLLRGGAPPGGKKPAKSASSWSALVFTCQGGALGIEGLLRSCVDVNSINLNGDTALHIAACEGHRDIIRVLLNWKANIDARDHWGSTVSRPRAIAIFLNSCLHQIDFPSCVVRPFASLVPCPMPLGRLECLQESTSRCSVPGGRKLAAGREESASSGGDRIQSPCSRSNS
jgi:hypothetical protein